MKSEVLAHFSMPWLSCIALLLFLAVFCGAVLWSYRKSGRSIYTRLSQLPLQEESHEQR